MDITIQMKMIIRSVVVVSVSLENCRSVRLYLYIKNVHEKINYFLRQNLFCSLSSSLTLD